MRRTPAFPLLRTSAALFVLSVVIIAGIVTASTAPAFESGGSEFVTTYADDCATPKTIFNPGEVVCVQAGNFPVLNPDWGYRYRRFSWVSPGRQVMDQQQAAARSDPKAFQSVVPHRLDWKALNQQGALAARAADEHAVAGMQGAR